MENLEQSTEKTKMTQEKFELKEYIKPDQVKVILREWLNALEEDRDLEVTIKGENCRIPKEALLVGKTKAEYEIKKGEYELELELKWRKSDLTSH
ncbi:MAG TPA: hypothetical protein VNJ01_18190 [Bacteriovoracaceae bacterium]|nr:hypothetical protein [Bacteriovoracaceae bacterium]